MEHRRTVFLAALAFAGAHAPAAFAYPVTGNDWPPYKAEPGELPPRPLTARENEALFIAQRTWGTPTCIPRVRVRPNIRDPHGNLVNGQAWLEGCTIEVNDLVSASRGWVGVCTLVVHEWGHLVAQHGEHHPDPRHVMHRLSGYEFGPCVEADRRVTRQLRCKRLRQRVRRSDGVRRVRLARKWRRVCRAHNREPV